MWCVGPHSVSTESLFPSAISVLELERGVLQIQRRDATQGARLRTWLAEQVLPALDDRVLPADMAVALRCAAMDAPNPRAERDSLIAATALVHGLTLVTRNVADSSAGGLALLNPGSPAADRARSPPISGMVAARVGAVGRSVKYAGPLPDPRLAPDHGKRATISQRLPHYPANPL